MYHTEKHARTLVRRLETLDVQPGDFDHRGHVLAAWAYLVDEGIGAGTESFVHSIRRFVTHVGAEDKYHETLTRALLALIAARIQAFPEARRSWLAFETHAADLLLDAPALLARHYTSERLASEEARHTFVAPDLAPLPSLDHDPVPALEGAS